MKEEKGMAGKQNEGIGENAGKTEKEIDWQSEEGQVSGVVFVYITYYIYTHTKELAEVFKDTSSIRTKRESLFNTSVGKLSIFNFSRQRFERMRTLVSYRITEEERKKWEKKFNIDMKFFYMEMTEDNNNSKSDEASKSEENSKADEANKTNMVLGCNFNDWKEYFNTLYPKRKKNDIYEEKTPSERWEEKKKREKAAENLKVTESLKKMIKDMDKHMQKNTPIYSMYYYIRYNKKYEARNKLDVAMDVLGEARIGDWENVTEENSEKYLKILEKHYDYIRMKRAIKKIESEDKSNK